MRPHEPGRAPIALDYVVQGQMIGRFALVTYPAEYGNSGVMTFIVSHAGKVFQKDLGPRTAELAERMTLFNPDSSWKIVSPDSVIRPLEPALTPALAKVVNVRNGEEMADKVIVTILSFNSHHAPFLARLASLTAAVLVFAMASGAGAQQSFKTAEEAANALVNAARMPRDISFLPSAWSPRASAVRSSATPEAVFFAKLDF